MKRGILAFFGILGLWVYVSAGSEGMVRGSRAVGVSWDMGMAQGLRVGVWEGSEMVYCTTAASHLNESISPWGGQKIMYKKYLGGKSRRV